MAGVIRFCTLRVRPEANKKRNGAAFLLFACEQFYFYIISFVCTISMAILIQNKHRLRCLVIFWMRMKLSGSIVKHKNIERRFASSPNIARRYFWLCWICIIQVHFLRIQSKDRNSRREFDLIRGNFINAWREGVQLHSPYSQNFK